MNIHQSRLNMYLRCGESYRRRYVNNEIVPPSIAAARGRAVHKVSEINLNYKLRHHQDMVMGDLKDVGRDAFVETISDGVFLCHAEQSAKKSLLNNGLNETIRTVETYSQYVAPVIDPIAIEEEFKVDIAPDITLKGAIDYVNKADIIGDIKTAKNRWHKLRIYQEIQPALYSLAYELRNDTRPFFRYDILIINGTLQTQAMKPTDNQYRALINKIKTTVGLLNSGAFPPANPTAWWCSEKWCGYYRTCRYTA